ncbi:DNA-binding SARP family transcriptional activator [Allocatelliglobosispora scoriae]|uniref:DNA-binding SARP family transcriptional activator n=1 Tax=Allocatelliglobosispora scoriae TaxID=643052 RepID=A0A841BWU6_9ACTN|nr:AfsR/SARP family transcriptional regulator [Allocatelliglobosispora scoriae]MBB5873597.1 DNA-binding SARP family transcriptional activator [Allocatelliglobosispora scoriae]
MRFRVLGTLEAFDGTQWHAVPAAKWRSLLAALLVDPGRVVSLDQLAAEMWGDSPPRTVANQVYGYVSRLRRLLGDADGRILVTHSPGYRLAVDDEDVDAALFVSQAAEGMQALRADDPEQAARLLTSALGLWRGTAFADAPPTEAVRAAADHLNELRIAAMEARIEADLACGRHSELVAELQALTREHPLREGLWRLWMLALYRCGRQAEALAAYQSVRGLLDEELGIEPCVELRDLHGAILRGELDPVERTEPESPPEEFIVPRQLPTAAWPFVGRDAELRWLARLSHESEQGRTVISAIDGAAGIGKTCLAIQFGHRIADRYPDGQLYVNLRGSDPGGVPVEPSAAAQAFLEALNVAPQRIPDDMESQSALLRSSLAGKRMLMLLDNARDADQVRPLLPGTADCLVIITSRQQLTALHATEGVSTLTLGLLSTAETSELFAARLGVDRVAREPDAAAEIIARCGNLPLALVIAAARAAARPKLSLAAVAAEMRASLSLDAFGAGDPGIDISGAFSWSFSGVSIAAARLFRLLGLHPGPEISLAAAASLAGRPPRRAATLLAELARSHLIDEFRPQRYGLHDLMRLFASEQVNLVEDRQQRDAATHRLLDHYLHTAHAADRLINPDRDVVSLPVASPGTVIATFTDKRHALDWFAGERRVLLALIQHARSTGWHLHTRLLNRACTP